LYLIFKKGNILIKLKLWIIWSDEFLKIWLHWDVQDYKRKTLVISWLQKKILSTFEEIFDLLLMYIQDMCTPKIALMEAEKEIPKFNFWPRWCWKALNLWSHSIFSSLTNWSLSQQACHSLNYVHTFVVGIKKLNSLCLQIHTMDQYWRSIFQFIFNLSFETFTSYITVISTIKTPVHGQRKNPV